MNRRFAQRFTRFATGFTLMVFAFVAQTARAQTRPPSSDGGLTVEKIFTRPGLTQPLLRSVQWSPDGKLLSFVQPATGAAQRIEVCAIDLVHPEAEPRLLVDSEKLQEMLPPSRKKASQATGLGRIAPQQYQWMPDGKALLFPTDDNLYVFDLAKQTGKRLLEDAAGEASAVSNSRISPDGRWVSFVRNHDVWVVELSTGKPAQLTFGGSEEVLHGELDWVYPEELDIREAYWWSPDSKRIAFLELDERPVTRYPLVDLLSYNGATEWEHYPKAGAANPVARVGVVEVPSNETIRGVKWIDTGEDKEVYLARVHWLDVKSLLIQRMPRSQRRLDLLLADTVEGTSRIMLTEEDPHWINLSDDLYVFPGGKRILWSSEIPRIGSGAFPNPGGYRHLYLYDTAGRLLKQLTHGEWEVAGVDGVDAEHGFVYFTATEVSVRERHLYRVSMDSGEMTRLTFDAGMHRISLSPSARFYVDTYSNAHTPPVQYLQRTDAMHNVMEARRLAGGATPALEAMHLGLVEWHAVPAQDGTLLQARLIKPPGFDPEKKYPAILSLYGGPHAQLVVDAWSGGGFLFDELLAQHGYLILTLDNRGSSGRGHAFETPIDRHFGELELADQLAGVAWLKKQIFVDPVRIGVHGWSYGGYMTLTAMFHAPDVFKAGFAGAPVTDWRDYDTIYTERYMGTPQENPQGYKNSSPVNFAEKLQGKLLIVAGTGDDNVHFANTAQLSEALINAQKYAEVQIYPGRGHGISDPPAQLHVFRRVLQFFLDNL